MVKPNTEREGSKTQCPDRSTQVSISHPIKCYFRVPYLRRWSHKIFFFFLRFYFLLSLIPKARFALNAELQQLGFLRRLSGKECTWQCRRHRKQSFSPWVWKSPYSRKWQPAPVFLPGKPHAQRSKAGYSPQGCRETDMTEHAHIVTSIMYCPHLAGWNITMGSHLWKVSNLVFWNHSGSWLFTKKLRVLERTLTKPWFHRNFSSFEKVGRTGFRSRDNFCFTYRVRHN